MPMDTKWGWIFIWCFELIGLAAGAESRELWEGGGAVEENGAAKEVRLSVPYTPEARQLGRQVAGWINDRYYRLSQTDIRGFRAVFDLKVNDRPMGKMIIEWSVGEKAVAISFQGEIDKNLRESLSSYGQVLAGPICGYLIRPEEDGGPAIYAARLGEAYVVDVSGGGKSPGVVSDIFIVSPDFMEVMEIGQLKNGTAIKVIRNGVRPKMKCYVGSMRMTVRPAEGAEQNMRFVWHYAKADGAMFVNSFSGVEEIGEKKLTFEMNLAEVKFSRAKEGKDQGTKSPPEIPPPVISRDGGGGAKPMMSKQVSEQASFVVYVPAGWKSAEGVEEHFRTLTASDATQRYRVKMFYGMSPTGSDVLSVTNYFVNKFRQAEPDLRIGNAMVSGNGGRIVFDGQYGDRQTGKMQFRCWVSASGGGSFTLNRVDAPAGELAGKMQELLTILSNVGITKGTFKGETAERVTMMPYRLRDNSASFVIPQGWQVQDFGTACFVAKDASGLFSFTVANIEVITPALQVQVPGVPISDYLPPHSALKFLGEGAGVIHEVEFVQVIPREDIAQAIRQVYNGPVTVEEFVSTFVLQGENCKSYTFGVSFGSRLNVDWRLWHITVVAPADRFDSFVGNFVTMIQSYKIDNQFAMNYIAQGMARLRQLQRQTSEMVARNASEIREMMNQAYQERMRSWDYIDYQRTNYIRGEQDWISSMEGGTVYHTDNWGTKNTATGEYWEGQPYNYVNFTGENPKYNESMTPINDRATYERVFGGGR
jgi:hypothetical protein